MSTPGYPNNPADQPNQGGSSGPGGPGDPFSAGGPGYQGQQGPGGPGQGGYPQPGGYQQPGGYPAQQGYPQGNYPDQQGGGYPGPQQGYGGYPGQYQGGAAKASPPVRPVTVTAAFWCWIATTVVSLISLIATLNSSVWDQAVQAGVRQSGTTNVNVQSLVNTAKIILVVVFLIFAAIYLLFAFKMHAGRNWARIVLTVFGALSLLSALTPATGSVTVNGSSYSATNSGINILTALLALAGIVLMYLPLSNQYFTASKADRQYPR